MSKTKKYDSSSIKILEGLDAVRKRPGMYIGSTDSRGLHHLVWEIVDNAIDEALGGHGEEINIIIHEDNSISVEDFGRGLPTGIHASGKPTPEVIFTVLHAGGKFSSDGAYKTSGGLHGVGSSVVNALSSWVKLTINNDGYTHVMEFDHGVTKGLKSGSKTRKTGTTVHFKPDENIFKDTNYSYQIIAERLRESAFLMKGLKVNLEDRRTSKTDEFYYENGIEAYVDYVNEEKKTLHKCVYFTGVSSEIDVEVAFQFTDTYSENIISFVNNVRTKDGGTHETSFKSSMTRVFNEYARNQALLKTKDKNLDGADIREGITVVISVRIPENYLQFEGQTKSKLGTPEARGAVDSVVSEKLKFFLEENKEIAHLLVKKTIKAQQVRLAARKARDDARKGKSKKSKGQVMSGKLTPAQSKSYKDNELFIVEGDSAGGSAKLGRDKKHQAILPLRGKVINSEKAKFADIMKNEEISAMINTIGAGFGADFNLADINYGKVIIMTDADTDGAHIQVLILTFLYRYMRELIEGGKVYIALPPLYKVHKGTGKKEKFKYVWVDEELPAAIDYVGKGYQLQRYKGLGEMNGDQLWETTMCPESRTLIKVTIDDAVLAERRVSVLMGDKVEPRRDWIENNIDFSLEDDYMIGRDT